LPGLNLLLIKNATISTDVVFSSLELPYTIKRNVDNASPKDGNRPKKPLSPPPSVAAAFSTAASGQRKKPSKGKTSGWFGAKSDDVHSTFVDVNCYAVMPFDFVPVRGRPNFVFFFVFSAEKRVLNFSAEKRCTYFRLFLFFGTNMAIKIAENSAAGQIYSDRLSGLLGKNTEKLLFLVYKIRLFGFKY